MRYFLITYRTEFEIGSLRFVQERFPSVEQISSEIRQHMFLAILNIFEFKSKEDFEDFYEESVEEMMKTEGNDEQVHEKH